MVVFLVIWDNFMFVFLVSRDNYGCGTRFGKEASVNIEHKFVATVL